MNKIRKLPTRYFGIQSPIFVDKTCQQSAVSNISTELEPLFDIADSLTIKSAESSK